MGRDRSPSVVSTSEGCPPVAVAETGSDSMVSRVVSEHFRKLLAFDGNEDLLRGVQLAKVLRSGGAIFENCEGSSKTYALSEPVEQLQVFLSHNWAVPRYLKFIALTFHFNLVPAAVTTLSLAAVLALCSAWGCVPTVYDKALDGNRGFLSRLLMAPVFLVCLWSIHVPLAAFGVRSPMLFLDKACIHQEDGQLKAAGISKLGAFLLRSDRMLILYTPLYLEKLWTVYEVASFLAVRDVADIDVVPVYRPLVFCVLVVILWLQGVCTMAVRTVWPNRGIAMAFAAVAGVVAIFALRQWLRGRQRILAALQSFNVYDAKCFVDSDRQLVFSNIVAVMKGSMVVPWEAGEDEALEAFNDRVRTKLSDAFRASMGRWSFSYGQCVFISFIGFAQIIDFLAGLPEGEDPRFTLANTLSLAIVCTSFVPTIAILVDYAAGSFLHLTGCRQIGYVFLILATGVAGTTFAAWLLLLLESRAVASSAFLLAMLAWLLLGAAGAHRAFRDSHLRRPVIHASRSSDPRQRAVLQDLQRPSLVEPMPPLGVDDPEPSPPLEAEAAEDVALDNVLGDSKITVHC